MQQSNEGGAPGSARLRFDPTINAGHVLTMLAIAAAGAAAYNSIDKRVALVEQAQINTADNVREIRHDVKDVQATVNDLRAMRKEKP